MAQGTIMKALSGFYYVDVAGETVTCRGRGKLRHTHTKPLVGDQVAVTVLEDGTGAVDEVLPRRNQFTRPAVANVDQLVLLCANVNPVTDPFLLDRVASLAESKDCQVIVCVNKTDLDPAEELLRLYTSAGFPTVAVSAATGQGVMDLAALLAGKMSVFTGNSGVGKSSLLNALQPGLTLETGEVSEKLGRGRHTTRHVELFRVADGLVADTPGFSSFEDDRLELLDKDVLAQSFREFRPFLGQCRFVGCSHTKEAGCAVLAAVERGEISRSRHKSYCRLYETAKEQKPWEHPEKKN